MSSSLRILSYNIHKGFSFANTRFLLEEMRHSIRLMNADMVFLQEVVGENKRNHKAIHNWAPQQFEYLADKVWPHFAYGKNAIYSHGHHGNAILSQFPFQSLDNLDVSHIPTSQRGILIGKIRHEQSKAIIHVICLHFGLLAFERRRQIAMLCEKIEATIPADEPLIIAGDFNDWNKQSDHTLRTRLGVKEVFAEKFGENVKTFPAFAPLLAMDRIYYRHLNVMDAEVLSGHPWKNLSDHCALYAEFELPDN
jgi:endonuclease/exonuclease/phosphatase family metal-dependent hydrolase